MRVLAANAVPGQPSGRAPAGLPRCLSWAWPLQSSAERDFGSALPATVSLRAPSARAQVMRSGWLIGKAGLVPSWYTGAEDGAPIWTLEAFAAPETTELNCSSHLL